MSIVAAAVVLLQDVVVWAVVVHGIRWHKSLDWLASAVVRTKVWNREIVTRVECSVLSFEMRIGSCG